MTRRLHFLPLSLPETVAMQNAPQLVKLAREVRDASPPGQFRKADQLYRMCVAWGLKNGN